MPRKPIGKYTTHQALQFIRELFAKNDPPRFRSYAAYVLSGKCRFEGPDMNVNAKAVQNYVREQLLKMESGDKSGK